MEIANKIIKTDNILWRNLKWLQGEYKSISDEAFQKLKTSLKNNSFIQPFNVWQNNDELWCLDGHHRLKAMIELEKEGIKIPDKLPANYIKCKNLKEAKKFVLIYSSFYAKASEKNLYEYIKSNDFNFNDLKLEIDLPEINFENFEINYLCDKSEIENVIPEVKKTNIKLGDIFQLGKHRILCGDAENKNDVERLINKEKIHLFFSDPPYGINIMKICKISGKGKINGGSRPRLGKIGRKGWVPANYYIPIKGDNKLFNPLPFLNLSSKIILWGANNYCNKLPVNSHWIVWDKKCGIAFDKNDFSSCELAWTNIKRKTIKIYRYLWSGLLREGNRKMELIKRIHPAQKPVGLLAEIIEDYSKQNEIVLDLFLGSGSTLIACEKTNRICYGMEIEPFYIQTILDRFYNYTGIKPIKIN